MKIAFFGTKDYDRIWFETLAKGEGPDSFSCEIHFFEANINPETAVLAKGYDAVCAFVNSDLSRPVLDVLHELDIRLLLMRCAGYNNIDLEAARTYGITILRVPGYSPQAVAEHAMALALMSVRRLHRAYTKVRINDFSLSGLLGRNFYQGTAGIIGTGKIGKAMANICRGFGMDIIAYDKYQDKELKSYVTYVELEELLRRSDLISLHCPLFHETYHIINRDTIALMKDTAVLVNTSRGGLIDTEALIEALRSKKFSGVGLDVYEHEDGMVYEDLSDDIIINETVPRLLAFPNVVITSHQGFFTREALQAIAETTLENARAWEQGLPLENEVK
ncbi:MAG: 2-hydroxyacid dehydrogenase [Candidatus Choladocola sp.]|nr:2-hydroxyacid dehydrogenase [Candidatus Choladocola sp.]